MTNRMQSSRFSVSDNAICTRQRSILYLLGWKALHRDRRSYTKPSSVFWRVAVARCLWDACMDTAPLSIGGDGRRLRIVSPTTRFVHNKDRLNISTRTCVVTDSPNWENITMNTTHEHNDCITDSPHLSLTNTECSLANHWMLWLFEITARYVAPRLRACHSVWIN